MEEDADYIVEISGQPPVSGPFLEPKAATALHKKPYVSIEFVCCNAFARVYINDCQDAYEGRCPKCLKPLKLKIGAGGTDSRTFKAY
jgi:hypothetical protein